MKDTSTKCACGSPLIPLFSSWACKAECDLKPPGPPPPPGHKAVVNGWTLWLENEPLPKGWTHCHILTQVGNEQKPRRSGDMSFNYLQQAALFMHANSFESMLLEGRAKDYRDAYIKASTWSYPVKLCEVYYKFP